MLLMTAEGNGRRRKEVKGFLILVWFVKVLHSANLALAAAKLIIIACS
jgi:hypothetical protein